MTDIEKAEYEDILRRLTAKCEELAAENARLRSEKSDALSVCKEVYSDPNASPSLRLKAAGLALNFERPRIESAPPVIELTAKPIEDLATLVNRRRARQNALQGLPAG